MAPIPASLDPVLCKDAASIECHVAEVAIVKGICKRCRLIYMLHSVYKVLSYVI